VQRAQEHEEGVARKIRHAFRRVAASLPEYELPGVRARGAAANAEARSAGDANASASGDGSPNTNGLSDGVALAPSEAPAENSRIEREPIRVDEDGPMLFPPGPLARVRSIRRACVAPGALQLRGRASTPTGGA
jgi:hypothetical protein